MYCNCASNHLYSRVHNLFPIIMHDRYTSNLSDARKVGIKKGAVSGASLGFLFLIMFGTYGLAFWYGSKLTLDKEITVGDLLVSFFGVLIGAFSLGQVIVCGMELYSIPVGYLLILMHK